MSARHPLDIWLPWVGFLVVVVIALVAMPIIKQSRDVAAAFDVTADDPPTGSHINLPKANVFGKPINPSQRTLLVYAGNCSSCSKITVKPEDLDSAPFEQVLFVQIAKADDLRSQHPAMPPKVRLIADPDAKFSQMLKTQVSPRFYVLQDSSISSIWKDTKNSPTDWIGKR